MRGERSETTSELAGQLRTGCEALLSPRSALLRHPAKIFLGKVARRSPSVRSDRRSLSCTRRAPSLRHRFLPRVRPDASETPSVCFSRRKVSPSAPPEAVSTRPHCSPALALLLYLPAPAGVGGQGGAVNKYQQIDVWWCAKCQLEWMCPSVPHDNRCPKCGEGGWWRRFRGEKPAGPGVAEQAADALRKAFPNA